MYLGQTDPEAEMSKRLITGNGLDWPGNHNLCKHIQTHR